MYSLSWIVLGWLSYLSFNAFFTRFGFEYIIPDCMVIVIAFVATRRNLLALVYVTCCLGYIVGRQALGPTGLHETALTLSGLSVYFALGHLTVDNRFIFGLLSGVTVMGYHSFLFSLTWLFGAEAYFSSWATAILFPTGLLTAAIALLAYPLLEWFEGLVSVDKQEVFLSWR
tara:strand:- start:20 stop:535 length:516 start_codon:yes stop_codon:yes gene_type:complete